MSGQESPLFTNLRKLAKCTREKFIYFFFNTFSIICLPLLDQGTDLGLPLA